MKYFITGATGFIGGNLARRLAAGGHEIHVLAREVHKAEDLKALGIKVFKGDITDKSSLPEPMEGMDGVFHVAGWYKVGVRDKSMAYAINVNGTWNVLEVMKELGIKKGVYTSTLAINSDTHGQVYDEHYRFNGKHLSEYDRTKWLAHYEVAEKFIAGGLPLVIVMPGLVYGPGDTSAAAETFRQYLSGKLALLPQRTAYCWAHVDDTVEGHILAMQKGRPGESYIIAGPVHTLTETMEIARSITGIRPPMLKLSPGILKFLSGMTGVFEKFIPVPELYSSEMMRVNAGVTYLGDNTKAHLELGFNPRPLEEGLRETLELMREEMKK